MPLPSSIQSKPKPFAPSRTAYTTPNGTPLVLVLDYWKGFKTYWVESPTGERLCPRRFYNPEVVADILKGD